MARTARCKFTVTSFIPNEHASHEGAGTVTMEAVYDEPLTEDDAGFSKYTPWGSMEFGVENPALDGFFKVGESYYIDISPASEG
jgi:hypothetical protein